MAKLLFIFFVIAIIFQANKIKAKYFFSGKLPPISSNSTGNNDPCFNKNHCAVIYLAPWCSACNQLAPQLIQLLQKANSLHEIGIAVIIGKGRTHEENESYAKKFGVNALVDNDEKIEQALGISYYPTFLIFDKNRKIILKDMDAMNWINSKYQ